MFAQFPSRPEDRSMRRSLFALSLLLVLRPAAGASPFTALSVRELAYPADAIVVAVPADRKQPGPCKVVRQFKGGGALVGQEITPAGLEAFFPADGPLDWGQVREVCLFLTGDGSRRLLPTGLRCASKDGAVWRPVSAGKPDAFQLATQVPSSWDDFLRRLETDLPAANRLRFLGGLPPGSRRNQALLDWIEAHRLEFPTTEPSNSRAPYGQTFTPETPGEVQDRREQGWGDLEILPFQWVLDSGLLPDCWRAIQLYAEVHGGECLGLGRALFCSPAGRAFLVRIACEEGRLEGQRRRALRLLASPATLHGKSRTAPARPPVPLDTREQGEILDRLKPLLQARSAGLRAQAAGAAQEASRPPGGAEAFDRRLLPALVQAYKAEKPGPAREALAEAVRQVGGAQQWQTLTGRKNGLAGYVQDLTARGDTLFFWLELRGGELRVHEVPTLVLERLDKTGKVVETKSRPLPAAPVTPGLWATGWDGSMALYAEFSAADLEMGDWRLTVEGTAGKEKAPWRSEPRLFQVVALRKPGELQPVNPMVPVKRYAVVEADD
jgi:hypothetical protein